MSIQSKKTYRVDVAVTLVRSVSVEAESEADAIRQAQDDYENGGDSELCDYNNYECTDVYYSASKEA